MFFSFANIKIATLKRKFLKIFLRNGPKAAYRYRLWDTRDCRLWAGDRAGDRGGGVIVELKGCFFTADYRDGQVYSGGKKYPAGHFTVQLMNQYYVQDTAARIAVYQDAANGHVLD